jgi:citrate/tricarballylate utilization protein
MPGTDLTTKTLKEADRLMTVCNSCRYCEGLCAVFPAMEMRQAFTAGDLNYLANLCHSCGACYVDCQFSPPHDFNVNVPKVLSELRAETYADYAWPRAAAGLFKRNGLSVALIAALSVALFIGGFMAFNDPAVMFGSQRGPGAFFRLMPHSAMAGLFMAVSLYALLAMTLSVRAFWLDTGAPAVSWAAVWQATKDASTLKYLDGGGVGCTNEEEKPDNRRLYHHFTFYGFMLCFAATCVATVYHYVLGRISPYPWWDLPPLLGTLGGIGLLIGPVGLLVAKGKRDPVMRDEARYGMEVAFLVMLFLTSLSGLLLLVLRHTPAMGTMLALHLGLVFGLFLTMPYGKFVHGLYRFAALVRYALERKMH